MDNSDIIIEGSTATWNMPRIEGSLGGTYVGSWTFRCFLDPIRQLQAGKEYRSLLGELAAQASSVEEELAFALIQLKYRVIKAPAFWTSTLNEDGYSGNIGDLNVIGVVLDAAMRAQNLFKEKIQKERENLLDKTIKKAEDLLQKGNE